MTAPGDSAVAPERRAAAFRLAIRHYLRQAWRDRRMSLPGLILPGIGNIFIYYIPPLVVARVLGILLEEDNPGLGDIGGPVLLFMLFWLTAEATWRVAIYFIIEAETRGMQALYVDGMDALLDKDLTFFHDNFAGSLTKRVLGYAKNYEQVFDTMTFEVLSNLVPLAFVIPVLWTYSPWLVLVLLVAIALTGSAVVPFIRRRKKLVDDREEASNVLAGHVADTIANMDAVRTFSREPEEAATHRRNVAGWTGKAARSWHYSNTRIDLITSPFYVATNTIGIVVAALLGRDGTLGFEAVFVTFTYFANTTRIVWEFNDIYRNLESAFAEVAQFTELLLDEPTVLDPADPEPLAPVDSSVELRDVVFRYPTSAAAAPLFDGLSLRIEPGEKVGLVGRSGGGKSTITRLLLRLMDIDGGQILIGGHDIARLRQADLRSLIAYVPQDPAMFHRTLRDNIAYGRPDATDDELRAAAAAAHAAEFIEALPDGYDTLVGERGIKLSGGQRQRIAIARALLRHSPVLVLDEATSSLDSESEAHIQAALLSLMEDRTAIVIAHRLSTVRRMDRLVVVEHGRIVEQGSHDALLAAAGSYASLWANQSGGFLGDGDADGDGDGDPDARSVHPHRAYALEG